MLALGPGIIQWVARRIKTHKYDLERDVGLGLMVEDQIVCGVLYEGFTGRSVMAHIACDGPMTKKFLWAIFDYPFNQLGVEKIIAPIKESNAAARKLVERLGMREETRLKDTHPEGDLLFYAIRRHECRWIGAKHG